ncbi:uncharacterized protein [Diadema setosum]|uniref:uncharacterized protein n=1 Tax=Diadema setosum TaxID=31175 RepID=UPI003B3A0171
MPQRCVVAGCSNTTKDGVSLHQFPKDENVRRMWTAKVKLTRAKWSGPSESSVLCSAHFKEDDFVESGMHSKFGIKKKRMLKSSAVPNIQLGAGPSSSEEKTPRRAAVKRERMRVLDELLSDEPVQKSQGSPMAESVQESQPSEGEESRLSPLLLSVLASQPSQEMPALAGQALQGPETDPRDTPGCSSCGSYEAEPSMEEFSSSYPQELSTSKDVQTTQQPKYQSSSTQTSVSTRIKRIQISVQMSDKGTQYVAPETEDIEEKTFESKGTLCKLSDEDVEMEEEEEKEVALEEMEKEEEQKSNSDSPGFTAHGSDESSSDALSSPEKPLKKTSKVRGRRPAVSVSMKPGVDVLPQDDTKYLVFEKQLLDLFRLCRHCRSGNVSITKRLMGTMLIISSECWTCNKTEKWESQSYLGNQAAGNVLLSAATLFAGGSWAKMQRILKNLKVAAINEQTFYKIQREILQPVIERKWAIEQQKVADELSARGTPLVIAGDGRADSPGHSAKFGVYTGLEVTTNKIIDIELVQSNEVKFSFHMELEGFKRFQAYLGNHDMEIAKLITDRHRQIAKHVREMCPTVLHMFDVWHIAKAVQKKVRALGKQKYCGEVCAWEKSITNHIYWVASSTQDSEEELRAAKWNSLANHMQGIHEGHSDLFPECLHGSLEGERAKKWLRPVPIDSGIWMELKVTEVNDF